MFRISLKSLYTTTIRRDTYRRYILQFQPSRIQGSQARHLYSTRSISKKTITPKDIACLLFVQEILEFIANSTNMFANNHILDSNMPRKWHDTSVSKLYLRFGLSLYMGIVRVPRCYLFWSTNLYCSRVTKCQAPITGRCMS